MKYGYSCACCGTRFESEAALKTISALYVCPDCLPPNHEKMTVKEFEAALKVNPGTRA